MDGFLPESFPFDFQWILAGTACEFRGSVTLNAGDNTISVPSGTKIIVFAPPGTNPYVLKLKQTGADSGNVLQSAMPNVLTWTSGGVIINTNGPVPNCQFAFLG